MQILHPRMFMYVIVGLVAVKCCSFDGGDVKAVAAVAATTAAAATYTCSFSLQIILAYMHVSWVAKL